MDGKAFERLRTGVVALFWAVVLMFPLAAWKIVDILIWLFDHVSVQ